MKNNKDIIEKTLGAKLRDMREDPPADMWARVEASLERREEEIPLYTGRGLSERVHVRRRLGGGPAWKLAVAAMFVAGVFIIGHYSSRLADETIAGNTVVPEEPQVIKNIVPVADDRPVVPREKIAVRVEQPAAVAEMVDNVPEVEQAVPEATEKKEETKKETPASTRSSVPDWYREAEVSRTVKRRVSRRGFSASLYAANSAGGNSEPDVAGVNRNVMNGFNSMETVYSRSGASTSSTMEVGKFKHHFPVSVGLEFAYRFNDRLAVQSGVVYSFLRSEAEATGIFKYDIRQDLHYIGIPISVSYNVINRERWALYVRGGGMLEKAMSATRKLTISTPGETGESGNTKEKMDITGVQPSLSASLGLQFNISRAVGIYAEPGVDYYIAMDNQPESYRTENQLSFGLRAGFRFSFR